MLSFTFRLLYPLGSNSHCLFIGSVWAPGLLCVMCSRGISFAALWNHILSLRSSNQQHNDCADSRLPTVFGSECIVMNMAHNFEILTIFAWLLLCTVLQCWSHVSAFMFQNELVLQVTVDAGTEYRTSRLYSINQLLILQLYISYTSFSILIFLTPFPWAAEIKCLDRHVSCETNDAFRSKSIIEIYDASISRVIVHTQLFTRVLIRSVGLLYQRTLGR